jgi:hypothetical protein
MTLGLGCCCCLLLLDTFERTEETLDPDGVNVLGGDRYTFTAGSWEVDLITSSLVCNTPGEPLHFQSGGLYNIEVQATFAADGDFVQVDFGAYHARLERDGTDLVYSNSAGSVFRAPASFPVSENLTVTFYTPAAYPETFEKIEPTPSDDLYEIMPGCSLDDIVAAAGFADYSLTATVDLLIESLRLTRAKKKCKAETSIGCGNVCLSHPPASLTLTIGGVSDGRFGCGGKTRSECETECLASVPPPEYPDPLLGPFCPTDCEYTIDLEQCIADCMAEDSECVESCTCTDVNGEYIADLSGPCSCGYTYDFSVRQRALCDDELVETPGSSAINIAYLYFDAAAGTSYINISAGTPWGAAYETGPITPDDFCGGGELELVPVDPVDLPLVMDVTGDCRCESLPGNTWSVDQLCYGDDPENPYHCTSGPNDVGNGCPGPVDGTDPSVELVSPGS